MRYVLPYAWPWRKRRRSTPRSWRCFGSGSERRTKPGALEWKTRWFSDGPAMEKKRWIWCEAIWWNNHLEAWGSKHTAIISHSMSQVPSSRPRGNRKRYVRLPQSPAKRANHRRFLGREWTNSTTVMITVMGLVNLICLPWDEIRRKQSVCLAFHIYCIVHSVEVSLR